MLCAPPSLDMPSRPLRAHSDIIAILTHEIDVFVNTAGPTPNNCPCCLAMCPRKLHFLCT